jgi:hypothetical protein
LLKRVVSVIPPHTQLAPSKVLNDAVHSILIGQDGKTGRKSRGKLRAHAELIADDKWGISLKDLVSEFSFPSHPKLCCDHCPDDVSCRFLRPQYAHTMKFAKCGLCIENDRVCVFDELPGNLEHRLRMHEAFRRNVPCHHCWEDGEECDNSLDACRRCKEAGRVCKREKCNAFMDPVHDSCQSHCDRVHCEDGYTNITSIPRSRDGYNVTRLRNIIAKSPEDRIAVCSSCWEDGEPNRCDNKETCDRCQEKKNPKCRRIKCHAFSECKSKQCKYAHATHLFSRDNLEKFTKRTGARQR